MNHGLVTWIAVGMRIAFVALLAACSNSTTTVTGADSGGTDAGSASDAPVSPCGPDGPVGTYTGVSGGQGGATVCGESLTTFTGATVTVTAADGGNALLTVSGTGKVGDTTNCPATVSQCTVTATACPTSDGSTIDVSLNTYSHEVDGLVELSVPGGCKITYSLTGTR